MTSLHSNLDNAPRALGISTFCKRYGIGRTGTYKLIKDGKLASVLVGRRRLIPVDAAEALLKGEAK
jgi:excisionase family DNA binding protein